ncbi:hypothetical protein L484_022235 [Morus notabilis]|uniref:Uncharacterized protein n=1 Tax=Morus notabilis TaxID=981085 RepID=W9SGK4_9ROSA|nr:hypothetical protein L484_022235 [Morus notabilis]
MTIAQYFHKVKSICREISELDPMAATREGRMKRIIIYGLRPEFRGFVATVQRWPTQPSLVEYENLLAGQEAMAKQMGGVSQKGEEDTLYTNKSKYNFKQHAKGGSKNGDKGKGHQGSSQSRGAQKKDNKSSQRRKKFEGNYYNCEEEELALTGTTMERIDYANDWIIDSRCSNHITGDQEKL